MKTEPHITHYNPRFSLTVSMLAMPMEESALKRSSVRIVVVVSDCESHCPFALSKIRHVFASSLLWQQYS